MSSLPLNLPAIDKYSCTDSASSWFTKISLYHAIFFLIFFFWEGEGAAGGGVRDNSEILLIETPS